MDEGRRYTRREFVGHSLGCAAHMSLMAAGMPAWTRRGWTDRARRRPGGQERFPVVASEPWGRIERVADGVWALVSTPLQDRMTLCNGGIVAGRNGVVVIESYGSAAGADWMAEQATRLAGRPPTHVVLTHYHADHTGGLRSSLTSGDVDVLLTDVTRDQTLERNEGAPRAILEGARLFEGRRPTEIDLGDRALVVVPRRGHTDSDVTIELSDPSVVFCGDLVWNAMFPNYVDAIPSRLSQAVRLLRATAAATYVPGHGPLADVAELDAYIQLLDDVEAAARRALDRGMTADEAGGAYRLPAGMEDWVLFNPGYFARAIGAWMEELG
jgi:glyoxylase-like metal-dependent hydrolase (beta-lactamase superfamily II)